MKIYTKILAGSLAILLSGCAVVGPKVAKQAQYPYNESVVHASKEQLLLNIVRMRYRDNPYFLKVASITSAHSIDLSLGASFSFPNPSADNKHSTSPSFGYKDAPTIAYAPIEGEEYVKQLLKPIPLLRIIDLIESGWSIERVMNICVQRINRIENAPSAAGPTPDYVPEFRDFAKLAADMRILQRANLINLGKDPSYNPIDPRNLVDPGADLYLQIEESPRFEPVISNVYAALGVDRSFQNIKFTGNYIKPYKEGEVKIKTRTLLGALFYASQAVNVPEEHIAQGLTTVTAYEDGTCFDWDSISGRDIKIHSSSCNPKCAAVKVYYRGYWYYVEDNDLNSKTTFMLLAKLFNLQYVGSGDNPATPQLTIPVGA